MQIAVLASCIAAGWGLARLLRARMTGRDMQPRVVRLGVESFARVLPSLLTLTLIASATPIVAHWHRANLLRVAIPLVASFALIRLAFYVLNRAFSRSGKGAGFLQMFEKGFATVVWIGVALYITGVWPDLVAYLEQTTLPIGRHRTSLLSILQAAASVVVTLLIALWAGALLEERLMRMSSMHSSLRAVMARMGRALLILVAVLFSLSLVGIDLTVLSVFGGALGVGIGLGLQKLVSSYVSGFVILLERSLSIGDIVTIDKYHGEVTRINTRYTIVRSGDGIETVVPNEMLVSGLVQNYSLTDRTLRLVTQVTVGYQSDIEQVLELMQDAAICVPRIARDPAPQALLLKFEPDGFLVELAFWISDPENGRSNVLSEVNRSVWKALQKHRIEVPYPQREIRVLGTRDAVQNKVSEMLQAAGGT
ncbi:mechanosensitive ion channel family protein [Noviherbaspirillum cavernae]|uniref:mechanosensitive ion channel family protein n=1 Tax=Noviherbaspirillum cavernae TaxID=2320862 RepID=UPI001F5B860D|nr:mechanosensitive ion channel domain-containing protein [Noviherbaspirillum cavernae]